MYACVRKHSQVYTLKVNDGQAQGLLDRICSKRGAGEGRLFVLPARFWPSCPVNIVSAHTATCVKTQRLVLTLRKQANILCVEQWRRPTLLKLQLT